MRIETDLILSAISDDVHEPSRFGDIHAALGKPDKRQLYAALMSLVDSGEVIHVEGLYCRKRLSWHAEQPSEPVAEPAVAVGAPGSLWLELFECE